MSRTFGISLGADVVCGAILTRDRSRGDSFDFRMLAVDRRREVGDLVIACADLLGGLSGGTPDRIAVTYRSRTQALSVRAVSDRRITLVPEATAAIACLRATGELGGRQRVAIVDVGATGTATSVVDLTEGDAAEPKVLSYEHTREMSGAAFDDLLDQVIRNRQPIDPDIDRDILGARVRTAKEQLSFADSTRIHRIGEQPLTLTRTDFETAIGSALLAGIASIDVAVERSPTLPDAFILIGGGAHIPLLARAIGESFGLPVIVPNEPDTVLARGAAVLAQPGDDADAFAVISPAEHAGPRLSFRGAGVLAGAIAVATLVLTYGPRELTGATPDAASAVSTQVWSTTATEAPLTESTDISVGPPSTQRPPTAEDEPVAAGPHATRTLHPGPGLPAIPLPSAQPSDDGSANRAAPAPTSPPEVIPAPETTAEPAPTTPVIPGFQMPTTPNVIDRTRPDSDSTTRPPTTTEPPTSTPPPTSTDPGEPSEPTDTTEPSAPATVTPDDREPLPTGIVSPQAGTPEPAVQGRPTRAGTGASAADPGGADTASAESAGDAG